MRETIDGSETNLLPKLMIEADQNYNKLAGILGISRQAARQFIRKPIGCMRVYSLLKIIRVLGYKMELVKEEEKK